MFAINVFLCLQLVAFLTQSLCPEIEQEETENSRAVERLAPRGNQRIGRGTLLISCALVWFKLGSDSDTRASVLDCLRQPLVESALWVAESVVSQMAESVESQMESFEGAFENSHTPFKSS